MSYNGTVYCNQCYKKGHNRRTCPQLTESYKSRAQAEVDEGKGKEGFWHQEYAKRAGTWLDGTSADEMKKSTRRCKYCAKTGHNTRTCVELKEHKQKTFADTVLIRTKIANNLKDRRLGIGALVTKPSYYSDTVTVFMVVGFDLKQINSENIKYNPEVIQLKALNLNNLASWEVNSIIPLPPIDGVNENSWSNKIKIVGPLKRESVDVGLPESWIDDNSFLKDLYKDRKSPNYYDNQFEG